MHVWSGMELGDAGVTDMEQHPKVTLDWALRSLERALDDLENGSAERRVRRQFHQLLLAIERDAQLDDDNNATQKGG